MGGTVKKGGNRNRRQTEEAILNAVSHLLVRDGFSCLGINAVAREAGVDKVLIYRYFGGMPQLLTAFGNYCGFWPSVDELLKGVDIESMPFEKRLQLFIDRIIDALRARPLTLEILAMETGSPNELTVMLNTVLEDWGLAVTQRLAVNYEGNVKHISHIMTIVFSGIQHLLIRARTTMMFGGIPIQEDSGWQTIKQSLNWLCACIAEKEESDKAKMG